MATSRGGVVLQVGRNFTGANYPSDSNALPPDGALAVGTNHVVEFVNGRYMVFGKSPLVRLQSMTDLAFWGNAGISIPNGTEVSDPRIVYDADSQRWFALMIDVPSSLVDNRFLVAVSSSSDPTGPWHGFAFQADPSGGNLADFPTFGIDTNGVYLAGDLFDGAGNSLFSSALVAIPKADLLSSAPTVGGRTSLGPVAGSSYGSILQPAVTIGNASSSEAMLAMGDLGYDFQPHSTVIGTGIQTPPTAGSATLDSPSTITVPNYSIPINPLQLGGLTNNIDDGDARMGAMVYRIGDIVYGVHGTQLNERAAIQWFKLDAITWNLIGTGIISDPLLDLFYPSIAANSAGTVAIAYNTSSSNTYVSCYGILGEPINGTLAFGNPVLLKAGVAAYRIHDTDSRWGDYSAVTPDPADPSRFWALTMYPSGSSSWATEVTELIAAPLLLSIANTGTNLLVSWPGSAAGYELQSTPSLTSPNWTPLLQTPLLLNNQWTVSVAPGVFSQFFRLATSAPVLSISNIGGNLVLSWPSWAMSYQLQTSTTLSPANWLAISQTPLVTNGQTIVSLPLSPPSQFFRLSQ